MLHKCFYLLIFLPFVFINPTSKAQVLAKVGKKEITVKDFNHKYDEIKKHTINPPPPDVFLEDLIRYQMGVQEAENKGLRNDPLVIERFNQELYKVLVEKAIGSKVNAIKVNETEMKKFYSKNPEFDVSHILIEFKPGASEQEKGIAKKRAEEIYHEVKSSKRSFAELVKLYTDDSTSKERGGNIGLQSKVTLTPPIYNTLLTMKPGEIKGLVETNYGFHILKLNTRGSYQNANKMQIRAAVFDEKRSEIFNDYFAHLKKNYSIEINSQLVKTLK